MGYRSEAFDTLYDFHAFVRDRRNINPNHRDEAEDLAGKVAALGSALECIIQAAREYHGVATDELIWDMPGVAERHAKSLGFRGRRSYHETLAQAYAHFEMTLAIEPGKVFGRLRIDI